MVPNLFWFELQWAHGLYKLGQRNWHHFQASLIVCSLIWKTASSKCGVENNEMLCRSSSLNTIIVMGNEWWLVILVWLFTWYLCISRQLMLCWCMKIRLHMNTTSKAILLKLISLNISLNPGLRKIMVQIVRFDASDILKMKIFELVWKLFPAIHWIFQNCNTSEIWFGRTCSDWIDRIDEALVVKVCLCKLIGSKRLGCEEFHWST